MLKKKFKLTKDQFETVFHEGRTKYCQNFKIVYDKNTKKFSRFAVVVPLKYSKKATDRNKLKRRLYNVIKEIRDRLEVGKDVVIIVKSEMPDFSFEELKSDFLGCLNNLDLIKQE